MLTRLCTKYGFMALVLIGALMGVAHGVGAALPESQVAFSSIGDGFADIMLVDVRSGLTLRLTPRPTAFRSPVWSPDGTRLALESRTLRDPTNNLTLLDLSDGSINDVLGDGAVDYRDPHWLDDTRLTVSVSFSELVVDAGDGSVLQSLDYVYPLAWSPDGSRLVRQEVNDEARNLYVYDPATGEQPPLTQGNAINQDPVWSPDGTRIAYLQRSFDGVGVQLMVVAVDGGEPFEVTHAAVIADLSWSPDGAHIVYAKLDGIRHTHDVYVVEVATGETRLIAPHARNDDEPVWSPDGRLLAFISTRTGNRDVYVVRPDGSGLRNLTRSTRAESDPVWRP